ncbi:MAG: matrixin family metalloprotease [Candidatus Korobacteraceae bacterium]
MATRARILLIVAMIVCGALSAQCYLPMIESSNGALVRWKNNATTYQICPDLSGSRFAAGDLAAIEDVMEDVFAAWTSAPNTALSISRSTAALPNPVIGNDGHNVVCFNCQDPVFTNAAGSSTDTLAVTDITYTFNSQGAYLKDADIQFNPAVTFVLPPQAGSDTAATYSLLTVATHEAGHFFGLDHSAVLRAVMYPYASTLLTTLSYDDVAVISLLYPKATADYATGAISGTISLSSDNSGVYGAHVFASSTTDNAPPSGFNIRKSAVGVLTGLDGTYTIMGLPPDTYYVTAEPLDGPVQGSNVSWYDKNSQGQPVRSLQTNFTTRWH